MTGQDGDSAALLELHDWRRGVAGLYAAVRAGGGSRDSWEHWRAVRDELFRAHPQSPLPEAERHGFPGLRYFDWDPSARVLAAAVPQPRQRILLAGSGDEPMGATRVARLEFALQGAACTLDAYWLDGYAGGLFVPFRDATSGRETYGAGRYLIDSAKSADLGADEGKLVLDFNFAYQPSCSYDARWACPLAPPANRLDVAVRAGERFAQGV